MRIMRNINTENTSASFKALDCPPDLPWLPYPAQFALYLKVNKSQLTPIALQPRLVLATRQPSVVAIGTWYSFPSRQRGPATPTGMGI